MSINTPSNLAERAQKQIIGLDTAKVTAYGIECGYKDTISPWLYATPIERGYGLSLKEVVGFM